VSWKDIEVRRLERGDKTKWRDLWDAYQTFHRIDLPGIVTQTAWDRLMDGDEPLFGLCALLDDGRMAGIAHCNLSLST